MRNGELCVYSHQTSHENICEISSDGQTNHSLHLLSFKTGMKSFKLVMSYNDKKQKQKNGAGGVAWGFRITP